MSDPFLDSSQIRGVFKSQCRLQSIPVAGKRSSSGRRSTVKAASSPNLTLRPVKRPAAKTVEVSKVPNKWYSSGFDDDDEIQIIDEKPAKASKIVKGRKKKEVIAKRVFIFS